MPMREQTTNGVTFLAADGFLAAGGVAHGFSTRLGGVSAAPFDSLDLGYNRGDDPSCVAENYRRFCAAIGADHTRVVKSRQIHTDNIRTVTAADAGVGLCDPAPYEADGLVTDAAGLCLTVFTADCVPVLLYDPVSGSVAGVHAGWRGTALGIVCRAVEAMEQKFGAKPGHIRVAIGPSIGKCCFETHEDVPAAMKDALGGEAEEFITPAGEKFHVDLKGINAHWLRRAGVENVDVSGECTACAPERFWSHRVTGGKRGAQAAVIMRG